MLTKKCITLYSIATAAIMIASGAAAEKPELATAADAKAMLERVVAAMKADPSRTIAQINRGDREFRDRDIYPTCAGPDGKNVAHPDPARIGLVQKDIKDANGKAYGAEFATLATEGKFAEVDYMYPRPGPDKTPVQKVAFVTRIADYVCLVGYYK
jgi:hypothetical protein